MKNQSRRRVSKTLLSLQIRYEEEGRQEMNLSLFSLLPETMETQHAREASHLQSEVRGEHTHCCGSAVSLVVMILFFFLEGKRAPI